MTNSTMNTDSGQSSSESSSAAQALSSLRVPPHSIEAEQSLLGGLMLDNASWDKVADVVTEKDFYRQDHRLIFAAIAKLIDSEHAVDAITVSQQLKASNQLDDSGGMAYLSELVKNTPSAANIKAYADIIKERYTLRQLITVASEISEQAYDTSGRSSAEVLDEAERKVFQIAEARPNQGGPEKVNPIITKALKRIDELFHSDGGITGVTTGFKDLDEATSGLQPSDLIIVAGRPSMGKCIGAGSWLVHPETGALQTIDEMVSTQSGAVTSLTDQFKLTSAHASHFVDDGIKPVFRVTTALGRKIETTLTHPFLTANGWQPLENLQVGDQVAVPRELPVFGVKDIPESHVKALAYFIADGGTTQSSPLFTNTNTRIVEDFTAAMVAFPGIKVVPVEGTDLNDSSTARAPSYRASSRLSAPCGLREHFAAALNEAVRRLQLTGKSLAASLGVCASTVSQWRNAVAIPAVGNYRELCEELGDTFKDGTEEIFTRISAEYNPVTELLRENGVWGKHAYDKCIPAQVFELKRELLVLFLNRVFACDGGVSISKSRQVRIAYGTSSERLAEQVQHLLVRFGIVAKMRVKNHHQRAQYEVEILHTPSIRRFLSEIGIFGKELKCEEALALTNSRQSKEMLDRVPSTVSDYILALKGNRSWREIYAEKGLEISRGFNPHLVGTSERSISRKQTAFYADLFDDSYLHALSSSDVYWDRIKSIESLGGRQVYDLTVPDLHNFVAQDICVHNTTFAMNLVENALIKGGEPVLVFSMEMPSDSIVLRMLSSLGRIDQTKVRNGKLDEDDWPRLTSAVNMLKDKPLYIDDTAALSPTELRSRSRRVARDHDGRLGLIMVDYLQLMRVPGMTEGRTAEISEISRGLKALAKEMNCPVVALSQLNRSLEQRPNKRPVNSDLRESGAIEQDADLIMFIYRDEVYNEDSPDKGVAEIIIGKQRNGPIGTTRLAFLGRYTKFEDLAPEYDRGWEE